MIEIAALVGYLLGGLIFGAWFGGVTYRTIYMPSEFDVFMVGVTTIFAIVLWPVVIPVLFLYLLGKLVGKLNA